MNGTERSGHFLTRGKKRTPEVKAVELPRRGAEASTADGLDRIHLSIYTSLKVKNGFGFGFRSGLELGFGFGFIGFGFRFG